MMKNIICIFPNDESTNFLNPIYEELKSKSGSYFIDYKIDTNNQIEKDLLIGELEKLKLEDCLISFLGHGCSHCLYGSPCENKKQRLFNSKNLHLFSNHPCLILSCRSGEFLSEHNNQYIGFGEMPTEYSEIEAEMEYDYEAGKDIDKETIQIYKTSIVNIMSLAIRHSDINSLKDIYRMIKLLVNKRISEVILKEEHNSRKIADMLCQWKWDIEYQDCH